MGFDRLFRGAENAGNSILLRSPSLLSDLLLKSPPPDLFLWTPKTPIIPLFREAGIAEKKSHSLFRG